MMGEEGEGLKKDVMVYFSVRRSRGKRYGGGQEVTGEGINLGEKWEGGEGEGNPLVW